MDTSDASTLADGVASAFALGWNVSELDRRLAPAPVDASHRWLDDDPPASERRDQLFLRIHTRVGKLQDAVATAELRELLAQAGAGFRQAASPGGLGELHAHVSRILLAEDSRLGKAYRLGTTLEQLCAPTEDDTLPEKWHERLDRAATYLGELHSVLPDHAAIGVLGSLRLWQHFAHEGTWQQRNAALAEQGRRWRSLLSHEKSATEDLSLDDYVGGAQRAADTAIKVSKHAWRRVSRSLGSLGFLAVFAVLLVTGIVFIGRFEGEQALGGGALALISGTGVIGFFKKLWDRIATVWDTAKPTLLEAAMDIIVAVAITQLPVHHDTEALREKVAELVHPSGLRPGG